MHFKKLRQAWSPEFKNRHAWSSVILNDQNILWKMGNAGLFKTLNYNTVLQLGWFCRKQGKWVQVTYVLLFFPLPDRPDLCLKGADLGCETFSSPLSSYFAPVSGAPKWTGWESGHTSRRDCLSLGRNSNSPNCSQDYLEDPRST